MSQLENNLARLAGRMETANADARLRIVAARRAGTWRPPGSILSALAQLLATDPYWGSFLEAMTVRRMASALDQGAEDREAYAAFALARDQAAAEAAAAALAAAMAAAAATTVPPPTT